MKYLKLNAILIIAIFSASATFAAAQSVNISKSVSKMKKTAKGTFEVKATPVKDDETSAVEGIGRLLLDKSWTGDLVGTSKGQMLGSSGADQTTGGYVAMEVFTGTLNGKGSFALQHNGTMGGGKFDLNVEVVPGSGAGELKGISGKLQNNHRRRQTFYELAYSLPK